MRITIFGCGYVGTVTGICSADIGNEIILYDIGNRYMHTMER